MKSVIVSALRVTSTTKPFVLATAWGLLHWTPRRCNLGNHRRLQFKQYITPADYAEVVNNLTKLD